MLKEEIIVKKVDKYIDLRTVPDEIIIGVFANVRGGYYAGVDELLDGGKTLLNEFKLIINPQCPAIIQEKKKAIVDETAREIFELAEKHSVITQEYIDAHQDLLKRAKYKIAELEKAELSHFDFYINLGETLKRLDWLKMKRPLILKSYDESIVISEGNAVYVAHKNIDKKLNVLYCEDRHKKMVDEVIQEIYPNSESSETIEIQTIIPAENE